MLRQGPVRRSATQVNGADVFGVTPTGAEADRMAARRSRHPAAQVEPPVCDTFPAVTHPSPSVAPPTGRVPSVRRALSLPVMRRRAAPGRVLPAVRE